MVSNLKRDRLLVVSNIAAMTITFLMLGAFVSLVALSQTAIRTLEKQAQVTLFFKDEFVEDQILELKTELEKDERVAAINYVSKEDAFRIFTELNSSDPILLESISASILPASLEIKTKDISDLGIFAEELSALDGVEEVKFFRDVIESFRRWSNIAYTIGFVLVALFLFISLSVIIVTLRITISSRGQELEILKLVGASDSYVRNPLVRQGMIFGLISSLIASTVLVSLTLVIQLSGLFGYVEFSFLPNFIINILVFSLMLSFFLVVSGLALGYFGSLFAIKKYLKY